LGAAEDWYRKSLTIKEELGNRPGMATSYHQLGRVAQDRGDLGAAEDWYRKSLTIAEELGNRPGMADSYHQLGMVAQDRGELGQAEEWYRKSLTIREELGNRPGLALTYGQLGLLAEQGGDEEAALVWTVRCVSLFDVFPHPLTGPGPQHLVRLANRLGTGVLERCWRQVTSQRLPQGVRDMVVAGEGNG
jgi:tetratricopeptide (TPR) repeat protein